MFMLGRHFPNTRPPPPLTLATLSLRFHLVLCRYLPHSHCAYLCHPSLLVFRTINLSTFELVAAFGMRLSGSLSSTIIVSQGFYYI